MKYRKMLMVILVIMILMISSCEKPPEVNDPMTTGAENGIISDTDKNKSPVNSPVEYPVDEKFVHLLSETKILDIKEPNSHSKEYAMFDNKIYMIPNLSRIFELNASTGQLDLLCKDPLCSHDRGYCLSSSVISIYALDSDDDKLFVNGYGLKDGLTFAEGSSKSFYFVGYADFKKNCFVYLDKWDYIPGYMDDCVQIYKEYLYYIKKSSENKNALYKIKKDGTGSPEKIDTGNSGFIYKFIITDDGIFYTTDPNSLYNIPHDSKNETLITDKATQFFVTGNKVYYKTSSAMNVTANYFTDGKYIGEDDIDFIQYDLKTGKNQLLLSSGIYKFGVFFTKEKIYYMPLEPVNYGNITQNGMTFENINATNGKVNVFNINSNNKSAICKAEGDFFSSIIYFACDEYMIINLQSYSEPENDANIYFVSTINGNYVFYPMYENR